VAIVPAAVVVVVLAGGAVVVGAVVVGAVVVGAVVVAAPAAVGVFLEDPHAVAARLSKTGTTSSRRRFGMWRSLASSRVRVFA
jgi:hypothetical protein